MARGKEDYLTAGCVEFLNWVFIYFVLHLPLFFLFFSHHLLFIENSWATWHMGSIEALIWAYFERFWEPHVRFDFVPLSTTSRYVR